MTGEPPPTPFACHNTPLRAADCDRRTKLAGPVEATALGNVLVQARAAGFIEGSLDAMRALVARSHTSRRYDPKRMVHRW